jgi:tetratricopeptide (TPR) repeat protein
MSSEPTEFPGSAMPSAEVSRLTRQADDQIAAGNAATARRLITKALDIDPIDPKAHLLLARMAFRDKKPALAVDHATIAFTHDPDSAAVCDLLARCHAALGNWRRAAAFLRRALLSEPENGDTAIRLAGAYRRAGSVELSQKTTRYAVHRAPLVSTFRSEGKVRVAGLFGLELSPVSLRSSGNWSVQEVTNNLTSVLDRNGIEVLPFCADGLHHNPNKRPALAKADLILNRMADPETTETALIRAAAICDGSGLPVINHPRAVLASSRENNARRYADRPHILVPKAVRRDDVSGPVGPVVADIVRAEGLRLPVLVRLAGFQGGKHVERVTDLAKHDFAALDAVTAAAPRTVYVIEFHDVSYTDSRAPDLRLIPKYRAFLVNGTVFPVHLFTSTDYNVHLANAKDIHAAHPWLIDLERDYCRDPAAHLGPHRWQALQEVLLSSGLDYTGVDFAPLPGEDRLILFEMNAAMRNWVNALPKGDHVQKAWHDITVAVHDMVCERSGADPWAYAIPEGL